MSKFEFSILVIFFSFVTVFAVKNGRVIGGDKVNLGDYPWQAAIYYNDIYVCAGTLLTKKHILTTRNCLQPYKDFPQLLNAHVGVLVAGDTKHKRTGVNIALAAATPTLFETVAIFEMDEPVVIGTDIRGIHFNTGMTLKDLDNVTISGWGMDDDTIFQTLHGADLKLDGNTFTCSLSNPANLCTYGVRIPNFERVGPCKWDEGTGLVKYNEATFQPILIGLAKQINRCSEGIPKEAEYIPTAPFAVWIADSIKSY